jgi:hypothetical protein
MWVLTKYKQLCLYRQIGSLNTIGFTEKLWANSTISIKVVVYYIARDGLKVNLFIKEK